VVVAARTSAEIDVVADEIEKAGGKGRAAQMNVREHGSVEAAVWRAIEFLEGSIDVLVNNSGVFDIKPFDKLDLATWHRHIEVNLNGPCYVTMESMDALRESGRAHVFNIASVAARKGFAGNVAYCASKYGLRGFSDALREDLRPLKIRVSTIYPGQTDTTIFDKLPGQWDRTKMNKPEDVAEVVWKAWSSPATTNVDDLDVAPRA
jgi:NADP-dependent 3-hydroxy acid dehydrogenase YdfG